MYTRHAGDNVFEIGIEMDLMQADRVIADLATWHDGKIGFMQVDRLIADLATCHVVTIDFMQADRIIADLATWYDVKEKISCKLIGLLPIWRLVMG